MVSRGHPRIVVWSDADLPHSGCGSSVRIRVENGRDQKANFLRSNAEGLRKTSQGSFELSS